MTRRSLPLLTACVALLAGTGQVYTGEKQPAGRVERKADPEAGKLLAEARSARAMWDKFPGFSAAVEVNLDGRLSRGKVRVDARGKVSLTGLDREGHEWARSTLTSIVGHRLGGDASEKTACAFGDGPADHPLGREVIVLDDGFHSSYRIRDRQIRVVTREMKGQRFTITVLKNLSNPQGKLLPATFVVDFWDAKTGELQRSVANRQTWRRVRGFDLPVTTLAITAGREASGSAGPAGPSYSAKSLTLSGHKLFKAAAR
jgi:hypothetical protein